MKTALLLALSLMPLASSFAEDCKADANEIAQAALNQVAKKYGFESADLGEAHARGVDRQKLSIYQVDGSIYKASYTVTVSLDESCALRRLSIQEDLVQTQR